ncbi:hypothetical protein ABIB40_003014 [Pedobacter sp. UYP30]|uniref:hypothetical protein n=1 Tax=Pedobacter sp. UYP30 TaxID=1756400 RepID=UPI003391E6A3
MRKITLICLMFLFTMYSCNGQHKVDEVKKTSSIKKNIVTKKDTIMERFDIEYFNKHLVDDERNFTDEQGNSIRQLKTADGFQEEITNPNSYFATSKSFYKNGSIAEKGEIFHGNGFLKGKWTNYDENGNIIKEVDYDLPFKYSWEEILLRLKKNKIDPLDNFTTINRNNNNQRPVWHVSWDTKEETHDGKKILKNVSIDGITGKESKVDTVHYDY